MAYDPNGSVVGNATALSDDIDALTATAQSFVASLASLRDRIAALVTPVPAFSFSGPALIVEGAPAAIPPAFAFSGPAAIVEGTPVAVLPAFAFTGPGTITEGTPPPAQYGFTGPATINEGN